MEHIFIINEVKIRSLQHGIMRGYKLKGRGKIGKIDHSDKKQQQQEILVNNAGANIALPAGEVAEQSWDTIYETNVRGGFFAAQAVFPSMREKGYGRIVFVTSQAGISAIPNQSVYSSSKAAANHLSRCLAVEWGKHGITVNAVAPTYVRTAMTEKRLNDPEFMQFIKGKIPVGKVANPEDVAAAVVYLVSDEAGMVNGSVLSVDGGWTAW